MQAEIITIGDELLIGQVTDTNSAWMGRELNKIGISLCRITTISDELDDVLAAFKEATERSEVVLVTGGLGPTRDDLTKLALCRFFNTRLVRNAQVLEDVERLLKGRVTHLNQLNLDQALVPEDCTVIRNPVGTAPILRFDHPKGVLVAMPGVPSEMMTAMSNEILPYLAKRFVPGVVLHKTIHVFNVPEAVLAEKLSDWEDGLPAPLKLAYLPAPGKLRLRLSARGSDEAVLSAAIASVLPPLQALIGPHIFAYDNEKVEEAVLNMLEAKGAKLATAESCSGGYMAHLLTAVPGASAVFNGSVVAYSNTAKIKQLGVDPEVIRRYGAVSQQVVEQMALGACRSLESDYAIASSGIAGPSGGSPEKPVGTVWLAWAGNGKVQSRVFPFGPQRERNILRTAEAGIIVLKCLLEKGEL